MSILLNKGTYSQKDFATRNIYAISKSRPRVKSVCTHGKDTVKDLVVDSFLNM